MKKNQSQAGDGHSKKGALNQGKGASAVEGSAASVKAEEARAIRGPLMNAADELDSQVLRAVGLLTLLGQIHAEAAVTYKFSEIPRTQAEALHFMVHDVAKTLKAAANNMWTVAKVGADARPTI